MSTVTSNVIRGTNVNTQRVDVNRGRFSDRAGNHLAVTFYRISQPRSGETHGHRGHRHHEPVVSAEIGRIRQFVTGQLGDICRLFKRL